MSNPRKKNKKPDLKQLRFIDRRNRRKVLTLSIEKLWGSLRSHLGDSVKAKNSKTTGNEEFHARCCLDYAHSICAECRELHELTMRDFKKIFG